ncbi:hypothetical protein A7U60_g5329 [Sanghuangporus baumii]|uniref:Uncharacterized protein n=1 Tax=Sanghuangporus baumii TaxID=108892 RepID=A0A9Q5HXN4_SANBA|nr:hypothetical protein A7U60_g5329 [Sanghuangporus baumii]
MIDNRLKERDPNVPSQRSESGNKTGHASHRGSSMTGLEGMMTKLSINASTRGVNLNLKPRRVSVYPFFEGLDTYATETALYGSYMARVGTAGLKFRLAAPMIVLRPECLSNHNTVLDSGARFFLINQNYFKDLDDVKTNYSILDGRNNLKEFEVTFGNDPTGQAVRGFLAHGHIRIGTPSYANIRDQRFYVFGLGPELLVAAGHPYPAVEDCPTVLSTIARQDDLQLIHGINISPWNEDPHARYVFSGHVHLGAVDPDICRDERDIDWTARRPEIMHRLAVTTVMKYGNLRSAQELMIRVGEQYEMITSVSAIVDTGCLGIGLSQSIFRAWYDTLNISQIPHEALFHPQGTLLQIPKECAPNLQSLIFSFDDKKQKTFKVRIPPQHMVFPKAILQNMDVTPKEGHLVLITMEVTSSHGITLGIPFYQERYTIMDCTRPDRHYVGFVKKDTTEASSPEFDKLLKELKEAEKKTKEAEKKAKEAETKVKEAEKAQKRKENSPAEGSQQKDKGGSNNKRKKK